MKQFLTDNPWRALFGIQVDGWRGALALAAAPLLLLAALGLLRLALVTELRFTLAEASAAGLWRGLYFDLLVALYPTLVAQLLWSLANLPKRVSWPPVAFFVWLAGYANLVHFKFFGMRLDWWILEAHWSDFFVVQDSAADLGFSWPVVLSLLATLLAIGLALFPRLLRRPEPTARVGRWWQWRLRRVAGLGLLLLLCLLLYRGPRWLGGRKGSDILSDNIVRVWVSQTSSKKGFAGAGTGWYGTWADGFDQEDPSRANRILGAYHAFVDPGVDRPANPIEPVGTAGTWPLNRELEAEPELQRELRGALGLPLDGPIHVIMLFLESVRAYEIYHPEVGPLVFPGFRRVLDEHSIQFPQAYSSSYSAGQTVRGQFSTLCSMLPNMTGAATYIAHPHLQVRCLQQILRENGYQTSWMNTHHAGYHNKRTFEMMHGTERFFEEEDFRARGVTETIGNWGLADQPFLLEVIDLVEELAAGDKPVFANVLTISVHHPYSYIPQGALPEELDQAEGMTDRYRAYLSRLRYEDQALTSFFEAFFASPLADNTLIALTADHSAPVGPHHEIGRHQLEEIIFRVPFAFITADPSEPRVVDTPVHQIDMAPAIAMLAGVTGPVTWVGRNPFAGSGSPWIYRRGEVLMFRTPERGCYPLDRKGPVRCYDVAGLDPMYSRRLRETLIDEEIGSFFDNVVRANMHSIVLNLVQPPPGTSVSD